MRKVILYGLILASMVAISFFTAWPIERKVLSPDGTISLAAATKPSQVEVTNFPAVQPVSGTVSIGNLPAIQTVSGTVSVGNLPLDGSGHVLVAVQNAGSGALVLHSTSATYQGDLGGRTGATQKCRAEFPNSHFAGAQEVLNAAGQFNVATAFLPPGVVWLTSETLNSWVDQFPGVSCGQWQGVIDPSTNLPYVGTVVTAKGGNLMSEACDQTRPLLCAE